MDVVAKIQISKKTFGGKKPNAMGRIIQKKMTVRMAALLKEHIQTLPVYDMSGITGKMRATMKSDENGMLVMFKYSAGRYTVGSKTETFLVSMTQYMSFSLRVGARRVDAENIPCEIKMTKKRATAPTKYAKGKIENGTIHHRGNKYSLYFGSIVEMIAQGYHDWTTQIIESLIDKAVRNE